MLRRRGNRNRTAQSFVEYTMVVTAVLLVVIAMSTMLKRGTQGLIMVVADQMGNQINADQKFGDQGYLVNSYTSVRATIDRTTFETVDRIGYQFGDEVFSSTNSFTNLGFTNAD